ncbi:hypothetical protein I4U23_004802 [Adineta vaga]|nr:hypothetical protein I4U23_004802 [Adineta vaga]
MDYKYLTNSKPNFIPTLTTFHSKGRAIFLFADNTPYVCHVSEFLKSKFGITVEGDYYGHNKMTYEKNGHQQKEHFGRHEIFTRIKNLFEVSTIISHPVYSIAESRKLCIPIATANDVNPYIVVYDPPSLLRSREGRLCLDCEFIKLYYN